MSILFRYTTRVLKANKGRTLVTIAGIVLSFALFTAVLTAVSSGLDFMIRFILAEEGDWYGVVYQCSGAERDRLLGEEHVIGAVSIENQGVAYLDGVMTEAKPYAYVGGADQEFCDAMSINITTGRFPERADEILVPEHVEDAGLTYRIGEQITLDLGERFSDSGAHLQHYTALYTGMPEGESLRTEGERTFTVVGFYSRAGFEGFDNPAYTFLTVKTGAGTLDVYFRTQEIAQAQEVIAAGFSDHQSGLNRELMRYTGNSNADVRRMLTGLAAVLCGVVAFVSVSLIYNAFSISLGERTKQFGLLKSIGATRKQIRMLVFMETALLCAVSIPAGLALGCAGVWGVLKVLRPAFIMMQQQSNAGNVVDVLFHAEPAYLIAAVAAGVATVMIAALIPAWRANRLSPIDSIRQTADVKNADVRPVNGKGIWGRIFGIAGTLAYKNAKRNKKPYRAVVFSMVTSLLLLLGGGGLVYYAQQSLEIIGREYGYDLDVAYDEMLTDEETAEVKAWLDGAEEINASCAVLRQQVYVTCQSDDALAHAGAVFAEKAGMSGELPAQILYVEDTLYKEYLETLGLSPDEYLYGETPKALVYNQIKGFYIDEKERSRNYGGAFFKSGADLSACALWAPENVGGAAACYIDGGQVCYYIPNGDSMEELKVPKEEAQVLLGFECGALVDGKDRPFWMSEAVVPTFMLPMRAVSQNADALLDGREMHFYLLTEEPAAASRALISMKRELSIRKDFTRVNTHVSVNFLQAFTQILRVFMMCFVLLLCLIAAANIVNTITTSVRLRTREYALLKSIGISGRTMFQMVLIENMTYSLKALLIGCPLGAVVNYLTFQALSGVFEAEFSLPFPYYIAGAAGTVLLMFFAVFYMRSRTKKGNVCEELRNEVL